MPGFCLDVIRPTANGSVEIKVARNENYAKALLFFHAKAQTEKPAFTLGDFSGFFQLDEGHAFRVLKFFVHNEVLVKTRSSYKTVRYRPINDAVKEHVLTAAEKVGVKI